MEITLKNTHNLQFTGFENPDGEDVEVWVCGNCRHVFVAKTKAKAVRKAKELPCHEHKEIAL